ncbi:MAG: DUF4432 family protein [Rhizobiaceae bacterium]|nr:DUF4432 family protein [Rhizobiaceae bacterium]
MTQPVTIHLDERMFGKSERSLAAMGGIHVSAFRYRSGVAALRVVNGEGSAILLPFQGQQVWDAEFHGRRLTMRSMFDEPVPTRDYLSTYGAFFIHCGGTSMGNPGPDDTHPLHGELPNLPYQEAALVFGQDDTGSYVELTGSGRDRRAFSHDFEACPSLRLHEGSTYFEATIEVENRSLKPMPFLYLAHINFRPIDGGILVDTVRDDIKDSFVRAPDLPEDVSPCVRGYHDAIAMNPSSHRMLEAGQPIEPELVLTMKAAADGDGWAHAMQKFPDGSCDFVSYRSQDLPYAVRWITRSGDQDALGLVLPATAPPDGLAAATKNAQLVWIEPGAGFRTNFRFGALDATACRKLQSTIEAVRGDRDRHSQERMPC